MNKQQVKGSVKEVAGEIQQQAGKLIGSKEQELKGIVREQEGKAQKTAGDVKEVAVELKDALKKSGKH